MKKIELTQGQFALVDDEDFKYLNQWKWCACKKTNGFIAVSNIILNGRRKSIKMHRVLMNTPPKMEVDHIDHNQLNNQKYNLRNCTHKQNLFNKRSFGLIKYKGVSFRGKYIRARININNHEIHLGYFQTQELAAIAYDNAARCYFGKYANLNFK